MRPPTLRRAAVLVLVPMALAPGGCGQPVESAPAPNEATTPPVAAVPRVEVVRPERGTIRRTAEQPGQIEAFETTPLYAKVAGYVRSLAVDIGDRVARGQVLAELDVPELEAELAQERAHVAQAEADREQAEAAVAVAEAGVASAEAKLAEVKATIRRAEADVARWRAEFERISQLARESAVTGSLRDETRSKLEAAEAFGDEVRAQVLSAEAARAEAQARRDKARADVQAAAARVDVARADARRVEALLGYTRIVAPYDGVITLRGVDTGHLTEPGGRGGPLFVVARTDRVTISLGVPEADAPKVNPGDPARVRLQALGDREFEGTVTRTAYALDSATRTLRAEIDLPNPDDLLRPGLYAYASIVAEERPEALTLPAAAVLREGAQTFCAVVADGRAQRHPIQVGVSDGVRVEVLAGLDGDEPVIAARPETLTDGQPVEPVGPSPGATKP